MKHCYKWVGSSHALLWMLVFPGYLQKYFKLHSIQREWPWIHFKGRAARRFAKGVVPDSLCSAHFQSIFQGAWNRHSAISVYHFCFTSISKLLFANRQRVPCESTQHFPFHLCAAGNGNVAICRWLFPIFPRWVRAWTQTETRKREMKRAGKWGWSNRTHKQTSACISRLSCPRTHRGRGHVPRGHFSLLLWPDPERWALTLLTSTAGHHYRGNKCVCICACVR